MSPRPFQLRKSAIAGTGAFATRAIPKGALIAEYTGERISQDEADRRYPYDPDTPHHTFLFNLDEDVVVDAAVGGNASRFINHSCDPNCEAVIEEERIWIYALKPIAEGGELLYDYQFILDEPHTPEAKRRYPCLCGAKNCRGTILAKKRKSAAPKPAPKKPKAAAKKQKATAKQQSAAAKKRKAGARKQKAAAR